jgi:AraC-like DNA-binding protein
MGNTATSSSPSRSPGFCRSQATLPVERLTKAEQMACYIAQHYAQPLRIEQIGKAVHLHPNYAMSLFKQAFSTTISDYIRQHRIVHAQRLLANSNDKILSIALNSGFGSISHFNSVFRESCGMSPRQYRQEHRV